MGIFYDDPPPPSGSFAGTPPFPHTPIGTQGDQPPSCMRQLVGMMAIVVAAWPVDVGPTLPYAPQRTAAVTRQPAVSQPVPSAALSITNFNTIYGTWPSDFGVGPVLPYTPRRVATVTNQPTVSQPVPSPALTATEFNKIYLAWPNDFGVGPSLPYTPPRTAAVTAQPAVNQPPRIGPVAPSVAQFTQIVLSWPLGLGPDLPYAPLRAAAITRQPAVSQPVPNNRYGLLQIVLANQVDWPTQTAPELVPIPPPQTAPYRPLQPHIIAAWEPPFIAPPRPVSIAPLTLAYGSQPVPKSQYLQSILAAWDQPVVLPPQPVDFPQALQTAVPATPFQQHLLRAWDLQWTQPPTLVGVAPLTLVYGSQPVSRIQLQRHILTAWDDTFVIPQQRSNFPQAPQAVVAAQPFQQHIIRAWDTAWYQPQQLASLAPLTLSYGQQVPQAPLSAIKHAHIVHSWQQDWSAQSVPKSLAWSVIPPPQYVPPPPFQAHILRSWESPFVLPPAPVAIAPLTLAYGDRPPVLRTLLDQYVAAWTPEFKLPQTLRALVAASATVPFSRYSYYLAAWSQDLVLLPSLKPNAGWNVPPPQNPPPRRIVPWAIWVAWEPPFIAPPPLLHYTPEPTRAKNIRWTREALSTAGAERETLTSAGVIEETLV